MKIKLSGTKNTRAVIPGSLRYIRSDLPIRLTDDEISFLLDNDVKTLIDLRSEREVGIKPCFLASDSRFRYIHMPVTGGDYIPSEPDEVSSSYLSMVDEKMDNIIDTILGCHGGVMYFCSAGKDRTGVVSALLLNRLGYDREYIIKDYLVSYENLKDDLIRYAKARSKINIDVIMPKRRFIEEFLEKIK